MADERLKSLKKKKNFLSVVSFLLTMGPLIVFSLIGIFNGTIHFTNKLVLTMTIFIALFLTIINMIKKYHLRSPFFIILLGLYCVLDKVVPFMIVLSSCVIVDEFFVAPSLRNIKQRLKIRDEMSK